MADQGHKVQQRRRLNAGSRAIFPNPVLRLRSKLRRSSFAVLGSQNVMPICEIMYLYCNPKVEMVMDVQEALPTFLWRWSVTRIKTIIPGETGGPYNTIKDWYDTITGEKDIYKEARDVVKRNKHKKEVWLWMTGQEPYFHSLNKVLILFIRPWYQCLTI